MPGVCIAIYAVIATLCQLAVSVQNYYFVETMLFRVIFALGGAWGILADFFRCSKYLDYSQIFKKRKKQKKKEYHCSVSALPLYRRPPHQEWSSACITGSPLWQIPP